VQLAGDEMLTPEALELTISLLTEGRRIGLEPAIESHRGTCTETPEKTYALADAFQQQTGELLPISWDFSHFAVVKHLVPENFVQRLLVRPDLIQRAQQFHFVLSTAIMFRFRLPMGTEKSRPKFRRGCRLPRRCSGAGWKAIVIRIARFLFVRNLGRLKAATRFPPFRTVGKTRRFCAVKLNGFGNE